MFTNRPIGYNLDELKALSATSGVPLLDIIMIALNREGVNAASSLPRARMLIQPLNDSEVWQIILPLGNNESPFSLDHGCLSLGNEVVASVVALENDDVVLTYVRAGG